jgi:flagellar hook protein FlgE
MSIYKAMWTGVSGLSAESQALGVVGDNVANANTIGFKMSRAMFEDILGGAVGQNVGGGVRMNRAQQIFSQGTMVNTGQPTDLALTGDGFFVVKGSLDGVTGNFYTRAGNFTPDADGYLVTPQGLRLQGYGVNPDGTVSGRIGDIQLPTGPLSPKPTATLEIDMNLKASEPVSATPFDPTNTASYAEDTPVSMTVYDSLGGAHSVDVYFAKTATGWDYHVMAPGDDVAGGTPGTPFEIGTGSLTFDSEGKLATMNPNPPTATVSFNNGSTASQAIALDFGTIGDSDGLTQNDSATAATFVSADGYASGTLSGIQVEADGTVNGVYSNGESMPLAQLVVAKFASNNGLARSGHNTWVETRASGEALLGAPGSGGKASVVAGALEQSNVDIAGQFVEMISHQRAFQANSKTITTADEMLQELVNLKR